LHTRRRWLHLQGVSYQAHVFCNGLAVAPTGTSRPLAQGMFHRWRYDLTAALAGGAEAEAEADWSQAALVLQLAAAPFVGAPNGSQGGTHDGAKNAAFMQVRHASLSPHEVERHFPERWDTCVQAGLAHSFYARALIVSTKAHTRWSQFHDCNSPVPSATRAVRLVQGSLPVANTRPIRIKPNPSPDGGVPALAVHTRLGLDPRHPRPQHRLVGQGVGGEHGPAHRA
jgi:hypothetical protein